MSKEIKFRAWLKPKGDDDEDANKMYYNVQNSYDTLGDVEPYDPMDSFSQWIEDDAAIIEPSTGLKDKNGKEIYKGDIVKFDCGDQTPAEVVYQDGSYFIKALDDGTLFYDPDANKPCPLGWLETYGLEVIGNIHENQELIERR